MSAFLVMDIGCLECGESSKVIGVYRTKREATKVMHEYSGGEGKWGREEWGGQHAVHVFDISSLAATIESKES